MTLLLRIFLSLNIFLLCGGFNSFYPLSSADSYVQKNAQGTLKANSYTSSSNNDARLKPLTKGRYLRKLLATEFEDDTDEIGAHKKHVQKADLLAGHVFEHYFGYPSYAISCTLLPGKLPPTFVSNKLYLRMQVFRI